jgi:hypothetical protein
MKKRKITLTIEKAVEWYRKGGELREVALQAFDETELDHDDDYYLDEYIPPLSLYIADALGYSSGEEFHYRKYFKQLIDIGVVKPIDENILKEKILEKNMKDELREYAQYEKLKKKFENYNPKEKYGIEI